MPFNADPRAGVGGFDANLYFFHDHIETCFEKKVVFVNRHGRIVDETDLANEREHAEFQIARKMFDEAIELSAFIFISNKVFKVGTGVSGEYYKFPTCDDRYDCVYEYMYECALSYIEWCKSDSIPFKPIIIPDEDYFNLATERIITAIDSVWDEPNTDFTKLKQWSDNRDEWDGIIRWLETVNPPALKHYKDKFDDLFSTYTDADGSETEVDAEKVIDWINARLPYMK
jgi:hypothetical protein